jgi:hypothetical protein
MIQSLRRGGSLTRARTPLQARANEFAIERRDHSTFFATSLAKRIALGRGFDLVLI